MTSLSLYPYMAATYIMQIFDYNDLFKEIMNNTAKPPVVINVEVQIYF